MRHLSGTTAIVGYGDAYGSADTLSSPMELATLAALRCLEDAGITRDEVDGLLCGREPFGDYRPQWNNIFAAHLRLEPRYSTQVTIHGAGVNAMVKHALLAVSSGAARYVLCVQADGGRAFSNLASDMPSVDADPIFEYPYRPTMAALYALICRRYMHEFGITEGDLASTVIAHQEWGRHHPHAEKRKLGAISAEDVLSSRMIASPLRKWMCSAFRAFGTAGAFLVTTLDRARDCPTALPILGVGESSMNEYLIDKMSLRGAHPDLGPLPSLTRSAAAVAARDAFDMAGLDRGDIQIAGTASNFAHVPSLALEDMGFCAPGEGASFIAEGHTSQGGRLPCNTNGGWMSFGQAGVSCVMDTIIELIRQLRGEALGLQVAASIGLAHSGGAIQASHSVAIVGTEVR